MDPKIKEIFLKLKASRPNTAQFVFFAPIFPVHIISARKEIIAYKQGKSVLDEIDVVLFSPGGLADDAYRLIRTLRKNFKTVNIIIPFWAKSAATLLSLGANRIIMDEFGEFGPLDAQIGKAREDSPEFDRESALNDEHSVSIIENRFKIMFEEMYIRLYEHSKINIPKTELSNQLMGNLSKFYKPLLTQIDPYKLGQKKRQLDIGEQYAKRILNQFGSPKDAMSIRRLVDYLIHECPDHGYVIDKDVMERFVSNIFDAEIFGKEFKEGLQELSMELIQTDTDIDMVGFTDDLLVPEIKPDELAKTGEEFAENVIATVSATIMK